MSTAAFTLSAKELAPLLGITEHAVRKSMDGKAAHKTQRQGRMVMVWNFTDLPDEYRARLFTLARERTNGDVRALFPVANEPAPVAPPITAAPAVPPADLNLFEATLADYAAPINGLAKPEGDALAWLLHKAFARHEELVKQDAGPSVKRARQIKAALGEWLYRALQTRWPERANFTRTLNGKLQQWIAGGRTFEAMLDERPMKSGNFRTPGFSADLRKIATLAVKMRGNESGARRILEQEGKLSRAFCDYYPLDERENKSALPNKVRRQLTGAVAATLPRYRGPKAARDAGPYIVRDWSDEEPGDWLVLDDVTWNFYMKYRRPDGRWDVTRGECLCGTDAVSDFPMPFLLLNRRYNGMDTRRLVLRIHDRFGLFRKGMILERGVWKSRFMVGAEGGWQGTHWRNFENGLSDPRLGLRIHHATIHRAKPIESVFHRLQDRMCRWPGSVGYNERTEKMERQQALIARAHRGDEEALAQFPTEAEAVALIENTMTEFAHEPGNGDRLRGRTPAEAWNEAVNAAPLRQLGAEDRGLLSTHEKIVTLKPALHGFATKIPGIKTPVCYPGAELEKLIFAGEQRVRVRIDLEHPEMATCYDLKGTTRFAVKGLIAKAMSATADERAALATQRRDARQLTKGLFGEIEAGLRATVTRDDEQTESTKEEGRFHNAAAAAHAAAQTDEEREIAEIHRGARALGMEDQIPADLSDPRKRKGLLRQINATKNERATTPAHQ